MGTQTLVIFAPNGSKPLTAITGSDFETELGAPIELRVAPDLVHVFDPQSGERLNIG